MKNLNDLWLSKNWKVLVIIAMFFMFSPVLLYTIKFSNYEISKNPESWAFFGDYLGGVLNPIISLFSLIVLAVLTWLVAKQSNRENYNLSLKRLRIDVLEEFSYNMIKIVEYETKIYRLLLFLMELQGKKLNSSEAGSILKNQFKDLELQTQLISECRIFFSHVFITKNHLFKYNFDNTNFKTLVQTIVDYDNKCLETMNKVKLMILTNSLNSENMQNEFADLIMDRDSKFRQFSNLYKNVIKDLKKEI